MKFDNGTCFIKIDLAVMKDQKNVVEEALSLGFVQLDGEFSHVLQNGDKFLCLLGFRSFGGDEKPTVDLNLIKDAVTVKVGLGRNAKTIHYGWYLLTTDQMVEKAIFVRNKPQGVKNATEIPGYSENLSLKADPDGEVYWCKNMLFRTKGEFFEASSPVWDAAPTDFFKD